MEILNANLPDLIGGVVGFVLTLSVFSYIFGDNVLFRVAIAVFTGVATGYAVVVTWYNVLWPQLIIPLVYGSPEKQLYVLFPLLMGGVLLLKLSPRLSRYGSPAMAYLVGVGAAAAVGGGILGTFFPQMVATMNLLDLSVVAPEGDWATQLLGGGAIILATVTTLLYFHYNARATTERYPRRAAWIEWVGKIGQVFIAVTFAVFFAGVLFAALAALVERGHFIADILQTLGLVR